MFKRYNERENTETEVQKEKIGITGEPTCHCTSNDVGTRECYWGEISINSECRYLDITLEEVILTYNSYARDLELSKQTESELNGWKKEVGKVKVKGEVFEKCKLEGKCLKCA